MRRRRRRLPLPTRQHHSSSSSSSSSYSNDTNWPLKITYATTAAPAAASHICPLCFSFRSDAVSFLRGLSTVSAYR